MMFIMLYGQERGAELCGRALELQEMHFAKAAESSAFAQELKVGWEDAMNWLTTRGDEPPLRWFEHVN